MSSLAPINAQSPIGELLQVTNVQFNYWIDQLNEALRELGSNNFIDRDKHKDKAISYWYVIGVIADVVMREYPQIASMSKSEFTGKFTLLNFRVKDIYVQLPAYKKDTLRKFVAELKSAGLIDTGGRGEVAIIVVPKVTVRAVLKTYQSWLTKFGELQSRPISKSLMEME